MALFDNFFEIPAAEFTEEDLQELFELFDPEKAESNARLRSAASPAAMTVEAAKNTLAESLYVLSLY
ncbi:hypothetical protein DCC62_12420 [candidate division KSB1 bacterium]|nr:MAG: hypothetical protein DCC62_12420 [candidate division KSB1 bacterium]